MTSNNEQLSALTSLLDEFYHSVTTNARKNEIEKTLQTFVQSADAWHSCLFYLNATDNDYVIMFCCNILETLITKRWHSLNAEHKLTIRTTLEQMLLARHSVMSVFTRNKFIKIIVLIGRSDWPLNYPTFMDSILQLCVEKGTTMLGLSMLLTMSEELGTPRDDISSDRRKNLHSELNKHVVSLLNMLGGKMTVLLSEFETQYKNSKMPPEISKESLAMGVLCIDCVIHLFSWIDLSWAENGMSIVDTLITLCSLCFSNDEQVNIVKVNTLTLSTKALSAINELLSKRCIPVKFDKFIRQVFSQCYLLLSRITTPVLFKAINDVDSDYIMHIITFLGILVNHHIQRFVSMPTVYDVLELVQKFTTMQVEMEAYLGCIDVWDNLLEHFIYRPFNKNIIPDEICYKVKQRFLNYVKELIFNKIMFKNNHSFLEEIDDSILNDDNETEWDAYIIPQLEIIAKTDEIYPSETLDIILPIFTSYLCEYMTLENHVDKESSKFLITSEIECRNLHYTLRDLSTVLQILGRLSDRFIGKDFIKYFYYTNELIARFVFVTSLSCKLRFYDLRNIQDSLKKDFIEVQSHSLAALRAYVTRWLSQLYQESKDHQEQRDNCYQLIDKIIESIIPLYSEKTPKKIIQTASFLLLSVFSSLKPGDYLLLKPEVKEFYSFVSKGNLQCFGAEVERVVCRGLSDYLILQWLTVEDQQWTVRSSAHDLFVSTLLAEYIDLKDHVTSISGNATNMAKAKPTVIRGLKLTSVLIESFEYEGNSLSKHVALTSLGSVIDTTLALFSVFIASRDVLDDLLCLLVSLFKNLRAQMGISFVEHVFNMFISIFTKEQLAIIMESSDDLTNKVLERFIEILVIVIEEPSKLFKKFIPKILELSLKHLYPIACEKNNVTTKASLFDLFYTILNVNWRYFFCSSMKTAIFQGTDSLTPMADGFQNQEDFIALIEVFVQSFLHSDLNLFEKSLRSLQELNSRHKLYQKSIFREKMMWPILKMLIEIQEQKCKEIYEEQISNAIYSLSIVDYVTFYESFLPSYLKEKQINPEQYSTLTSIFSQQLDKPSFINNMKSFLIDVRYLCILHEK